MKNILHITHPWGGGVKSYIDDMCHAGELKHNVLVLTCWQGTATLVSTGKFPTRTFSVGRHFDITTYTDSRYADILGTMLTEYAIDLIQVDSHVGHTFDIYIEAARHNKPLVLVGHDFFYICPTFHLVDNSGSYCGVCSYGHERGCCLDSHPYLYSALSATDLYSFRTVVKSMLPAIDAFVFPSASAKDIFTDFYPDASSRSHVIAHGSSVAADDPGCVESGGELRVAVLGSLLKHKGYHVIQEAAEKLRGEPVLFYQFGDGESLEGENVVRLGRYERSNIVSRLNAEKINVIMLMSAWPETFCYTLSEAISARIPVVVSNLGALAERVGQHDLGWIVKYNDSAAVTALLRQLAHDPEAIGAKRQNMFLVPDKNLAQMYAEYANLYDDLIDAAAVSGKAAVQLPLGMSAAKERMALPPAFVKASHLFRQGLRWLRTKGGGW